MIRRPPDDTDAALPTGSRRRSFRGRVLPTARYDRSAADVARRPLATLGGPHDVGGVTLPAKAAPRFRATVHGTVFGHRTDVVHRLHPGDKLILVPDPAGTDEPGVWVHAPGGDVIGHLPYEIGAWLQPWMLAGGRCGATVEKVGGDDVASWKRLLVTVEMHEG